MFQRRPIIAAAAWTSALIAVGVSVWTDSRRFEIAALLVFLVATVAGVIWMIRHYRQLQSEMHRLEKVRQDFVANVSHELRTPITAIRGYAETLRSGALQDAENASKMVEVIHRQSERLSELVTDLLELARLDARERKLAHKPVSLAEAASRATETVRPQATLKQISIAVDVPERLAAVGDMGAIEQVLTNLLDNAVKYTPAGGRVWVNGALKNGEITLAVRDSGLGIEAAHLDRVFERFYRVDRGRSRDMGGTGLGLSIVKHLVSSMRGDIHVDSSPGAGSTFTVHLPRG
ncbi:MAG: sensor histidine kinase [Myxococcaceae bacterium]